MDSDIELQQAAVSRWYRVLAAMQRCAANISSDTPLDLAAFSKAKHAAILPEQPQRDNFASCVFDKIGISVGGDDFEDAATFGELTDHAYRSLRTSVRGLARVIAVSFQTVSATQDPNAFEALSTATVFPAARLPELCGMLAPAMNFFPQTDTAQQPFRTLLAKPDTTVKQAIDKSLEV